MIAGLFRRRPAAAPVGDAVDPFERPDDATPAEPDPLSLALDEIETGALAVYVGAGLPTQAGHYRRGPDSDDWTFMAAELTPQERFDLALKHPPEQGWRFARLQDLGARAAREDLRAASRLLHDVASVRAALREGVTRDHLLTAMELGAAWRALRDAQEGRSERPAEIEAEIPTPPAAARDKRRKPR